MNFKYFFLLIFLIFFFYKNSKKLEKFINNEKINGICAFDIDGTILSGKNNNCTYKNKIYNKNNGGCTAAAVQACLDKNFLITVNTASSRDRETYCCNVGLCDKKGKCIVDEKNWLNTIKYYNITRKSPFNMHGNNGKTYLMNLLMKKYNIKNKKNVVLWDDYYYNILGAYNNEFGIIPMPNLDNCNKKYNTSDIGISQKQLDNFTNNKFRNWIPCNNYENII